MSEQLYKNLQKEYDLPEYEDWLDDMQDDSKRQMAFDNLSNPNFTYEDWTAELVPQFDPEADGYDASSALRSGSRSYKPDSWGSLEPYTGKVLLGRNHESWDKMVEGEKFKGNVVVKGEDGRFYSKKNINQLSQSVNYTPPSSLKVDYTAQKTIPIKSQADPRGMNFTNTVEVDGQVLGLVKEDQNIADKLIDFESGFQDDTGPVEENAEEIINTLMHDASDESWATDENLSYEEKKAIYDENMEKLQSARNLQNQGYKVYNLTNESYVPVDWNRFERLIQNDAISQGLAMGDLPQSGFFSELRKNWIVNDTRALQDQANYDIITGDNVEARETLVDAHKNQLGAVKFTDDKSSIIEDVFHAFVAITPDIKGYGSKGLDWGLKAGATSATVGGLATGGVGAVPAGIAGLSYGFKAGSTYYWYRQGTQELYLDLRREGIDHDIAIANAKAFAVPYASTELVSLGIVGKNLKAITKSQIKDQIKKRITKGAVVRLSKEYGKDYFKEIGQELTQELILDTGEDVAKYMSNRMRGTDIEYDPFEERLDRYEDVVKETAKAIIPIVGLGAGVRVATEYKMDPAERSYRRKQKRDKFLETTEIGKQIQVARDSGKYDEFTLDFLADMAIRNPDIIEESGAIDLTEKAVNLTQDYFRAELEKNDEVYTDEEWNEVGRDKYVEFLAGEGMTEQDAENIIATGSTENFQDLIEGSTKVLMKLNQGADVSTVVEEMYGWYHRALNDQESFLFQEYYNSIHSNPELKERLYLRLMENGFVDENYDYENNSLSSQEFFEKDGMNYFANQNLYEDSALRKVYRKVMEYFQNLLGISDISPDVVKMYEEAGQFKVKKVTQAQDIEISKEKGIGTPKSYQLSYMGSHRPSREGPPAHNLLEGNKIPDDVYDTPRYYIGSINTGEQKKVYQETVEAINYLKSIKGNPDAEVTVYRAGPKKELNAGDWITLSKTYAEDHSRYFETPVHKFKVKAKDVLWDMNSLEEWGYYPKGQEVKQNDILDKSFQLTKKQKKYFKDTKVVDKKGEPLQVYHGTTKDFSEFGDKRSDWDDPFFFTPSPEVASIYSKNRAFFGGGNAQVIPAYINLKNPLTLDWDFGSQVSYNKFIELIEKSTDKKIPNKTQILGMYVQEDLDSIDIEEGKKSYMKDTKFLFDFFYNNPDLINYIKSIGYDGVKTWETDPSARRLNPDGTMSKSKFPSSKTKDSIIYIAFDPEQIKSPFNVDPAKTGTSFQLRKPSTPTSSGTSMQKSVLQVAKNLKNNSIINPPTDKTPKEEIKKMKNRGNLKGFEDAKKYLKEGSDVDGVRQWYDGVDYALERMAIEVPEVLQSVENKQFALLMLAITSQGTKVKPNYDMAVDIVREYFRTGKMPFRNKEVIDSKTKKPKQNYGLVGRSWEGRDRLGGGKLYKAVTGNAQMIERLINDLGLEGAMQYLLEPRKGRAHLNSGYKLNNKGNPSLAEFMALEETHYGAELLGPKIGAFFLNLNGISDIPTLDLWWSRTWNRWMGTPTFIDPKSGKEKVVETPRNKSERNTMIEVLDNISEQLTKETGMEWSNTQVQALLWYYEKDLYQNEGAQVDPGISFREASDVRQEKFNEFTTSNDLGDLRGYEEQRDAEERVLQNRTKSIDQVSKLRQKSFQLRKPRVESVPLWESKIKKSIDGFDVDSDGNLRTAKGQPLKWKDLQSMLGVSKTEFKWSFVDDMLESKNPNDKVNKNELVNTLDLERIALEESVRGGKLEGVEEYKPEQVIFGETGTHKETEWNGAWDPDLRKILSNYTTETLLDEMELFYSPEGKDTKELNRLERLEYDRTAIFPEEAPIFQFVIASVTHTNDPNAPIIIESYIQNTKTGDIVDQNLGQVTRKRPSYRVWSDEAITSLQDTEIEAEIKAKTMYQEQQARELGLKLNTETKHDSLVRKIKEGGTEPAYHEDYTEHIITLPSLTPRGEVEYIVKPYEDQYGLFAVLGGKEMMISFGTKKEMEQLLRDPDTTDYQTKEDMLGQDYYESPPHHFEDKNIAVFVRHTTRYTPEGKKVLYIDELQSDWATDLKTPSEKRDYEKLNKLFYERRKQWTNFFEETKLYAEWGLKNLKEFAENLLLPVGNDFIRRKVDNFLAGVEVAEESGIENVNHDFIRNDMTDLLALIKTNEDISIDPQLLADFEYKTKQLESQMNITNKADSDHKNYQAETYIKTPPMPYEGYDYIGLALKRMIRKAVDQDYDYVAVTDGKTSADLYSARQVFETVAVNKYIDNGLEYYNAQVLDKSARKIGIKGIGDRNKLDFSRLTAGEVIRAFGKDLGEKIIKGTEEVLPAEYFENKRSEYFNAVTDKDTEINYYNSFYSGTLPQNAYETGTWFRQDYALYLDDKYDQTSKTYVISGKDLEVGGYMHKALYDNAIPNKMNKLGKKFTGTKVEDIEIASFKDPDAIDYDEGGSELPSTFSSKAMKITKTLREEGGKPMPSFQLKKGKLPNKLLTGKGKVVKTKDPSFYTEALIPISTRLKRIHPKLRVILRKFEFDLGVKVNADRKTVLPFLTKFEKMNEEDKKILTLALYNGYEESIQEMLDKYDMNSEYVSVQKLLEKFYNDALSVGYDINQIENYFPRLPINREGMIDFLGGVDPDSKTIIEEAQKKKEKSLGRKLTEEEMISIANSVIGGHGFKSKSTPRNIKGRKIENLDEDLLQFYANPVESLIGYIDTMNEGIASKKFFGKGEDLGDSIGKFVAGMVEAGLINRTQEREVVTILNARFNKTPMKDFLRGTRDATYLMTMGQFTSAVTQIGDLAWSIINAPLQTPKALGKAFASALPKINLKRISREDVGVEHVAQEMQNPKGFSKHVNNVFKWTGLEKIDKIGKETLMNATIENFQKKAKTDKLTKRQMETLTEIFEDEAPQVIQDLKDGKITENVKFLAFWTLMEFQPASKSEVPQKYLDSPNGRMFYQLKTFTIKQLDVYRNQFWDDLKAGNKARAFGRLATISTAFVVCNASADAIKDWLRGKPIHFDDIFYENLLRLLGMSKYHIWVGKTFGLQQALSKFFMPPSIGVGTEIATDLYNIQEWFDEYIKKDSSLPLRIPIVGHPIFYFWGRGKKGTINQEYDRLWKKFKEDGSLTLSDQKIFLEWLEKKALHSPPKTTKNVPEWKRKKAKEIKGRYKK